MKKLTKTDFPCTLYKNCMDLNGKLFNIYSFLEEIKNGTNRKPVEEIRQHTANGEKDKAGVKKTYLRAIVPTGYMPKGRKKADPRQSNGLLMLDYDNHNREWSEAGRELLKGFPGILAAYLTTNFGLRLLVYVGNYKEDQYSFIMRVVAETFDEKLHYKHDKQATTAEHLTSTSYDPDCFIADPAELKPFPLEEVMAEAQRKVYEEHYGIKVKDDSDSTLPPEREEGIEEEINALLDNCTRQEKGAFSKAQIDDMYTRFCMRHPLVTGSRNDNLMQLGRYAFYKRFTTDELDYLIAITHAHIGCREYNEKRIRTGICWGYTHSDAQEDLAANKRYDDGNGKDENQGGKYQKYQKYHPIGVFGEEPIKLSDSQGDYTRVVERCCPAFPDTVYENLPPFIADLINNECDSKEKSMRLGGILGVLSGVMPKVTVEVKDDDFSTNLYFLAVAPAGSGKSVVTKAESILKYLKTKTSQLNNSKQREIQIQKENWELERTLARKQNRIANVDLMPEEYTPHEIVHSAQTSRSSLIRALANNPEGVEVITSEIDVFNESLKSECGNHSAELRQIASNEPIECEYNNQPNKVVQDCPKMTIVATGTPQQLVDFIGNTHDGMASRCLIMLGTGFPNYIYWSKHNKEQSRKMRAAYDVAARKVVMIYEYLEKYPTHVTIPERLRLQCDKYLDIYTERVKEEGYENLRSLINRSPIHISRICAILASIRKVEMGYPGIEIEATEEDMAVAMGIVITLLRHECLATTMLIEDGKKMNQLKNVFKQEDVYASLPSEFSTSELVDVFMNQWKYSRITAVRILKRWEKEEYIKKVKHGVYAKTGKVMSIFQ